MDRFFADLDTPSDSPIHRSRFLYRARDPMELARPSAPETLDMNADAISEILTDTLKV